MIGTELIRDFVNTRDLLDRPRSIWIRRRSCRPGSPRMGSWRTGRGRVRADLARAIGAPRGAAAAAAREHRRRGRHRPRVGGARPRRPAARGSSSASSSAPASSFRRRRGSTAALGRIVIAVHAAMARRLVGPAQGLPRRRLRVGVHRPREEPLAGLVLDAIVREPREGARLPRASALERGRQRQLEVARPRDRVVPVRPRSRGSRAAGRARAPRPSRASCRASGTGSRAPMPTEIASSVSARPSPSPRCDGRT